MTFFSIPFLIAMLIQGTKIIDLIFTDRQKKTFQDKVEVFTLWLDFAKPFKYLSYLFEQKRTRIILIIAGIILPILVVIPEAIQTYYGEESMSEYFLMLVLPIFLALTAGTFLGFNIYGKRIIDWLTKDTYLFFVTRFFIFFIIDGLLVFILLYVFKLFLETLRGSLFGVQNEVLRLIPYFLSELILSTFLGVLWIISIYCILVLIFGTILFLLQLLTKTVNLIMWRIVQYNKGAVAAITLLLTFILGIADIIVRMKK